MNVYNRTALGQSKFRNCLILLYVVYKKLKLDFYN